MIWESMLGHAGGARRAAPVTRLADVAVEQTGGAASDVGDRGELPGRVALRVAVGCVHGVWGDVVGAIADMVSVCAPGGRIQLWWPGCSQHGVHTPPDASIISPQPTLGRRLPGQPRRPVHGEQYVWRVERPRRERCLDLWDRRRLVAMDRLQNQRNADGRER